MYRPSAHQKIGLASASLALLTAALWGGTPVAIQFSVKDALPAVATAALRFTLGGLFMFVWCWLVKTSWRPRRTELPWLLTGGLLLFVQISLFNVGVANSSSSHGSLLINTFVFWVVGIEHFLRTDRLTGRKVMGLVIAAASVVVVFGMSSRSGLESRLGHAQDAPTMTGDLLLLASAMLLGVKIAFTKQALHIVPPARFVLWHDLFGVILFTAFSVTCEDLSRARLPWVAVWGLLYQGLLVAGLCFAIQSLLLTKHSASQISVFAFSTPLFGVALGALFRGDHLTLGLGIAGGFTAVGILLVNWPRGESGESTK